MSTVRVDVAALSVYDLSLVQSPTANILSTATRSDEIRADGLGTWFKADTVCEDT